PCRASRCRAVLDPAVGVDAQRELRQRFPQARLYVLRRTGFRTAVREYQFRRQQPEFWPYSFTYVFSALSFAGCFESTSVLDSAKRVMTMEMRVSPSRRLATSIRPPCSSTIFFTIARPSTVPVDLVLT